MHSDIYSLLRAQSEAFPKAIAIEAEGGVSIHYADLFKLVTENALRLHAANLGKAGRRPRIGIVMTNGACMATTLLSVTAVGTALPFNPAYTAAEFETYFKETAVDALIILKRNRTYGTLVAAGMGIPIIDVGQSGEVIAPRPNRVTLPIPQPRDVALVLLTSGSTGRAKAVPLTHLNVCTSAQDVCRSLKLTASDRCLSMWEQYHVGGLVDLLLAPLSSGGTVICTKGFNAAEFYRLLEVAKPSWFQVVPTTLNEIVGHARRNEIVPRGTSLRFLRSVAAALSPRLLTEAEELFQLPVITTFGMTEAGPLITSTALPPAVRKPGSVGRSCGCEIKIMDSSGGTVATGIEGQVAIRGDNVFSGYEGDAAANATQFRDGWFFTGDLGRLDDSGELTLTGRLKQLINRGGEKVNPQEVDDALVAHPAVAEAACFPVAHATLGEDVAAAVVLRSPLTVDDLRAHLQGLLAPFKIPARFLLVEQLPRNAVGKVDRLALAESTAKADVQTQNGTLGGTVLEQRIAQIWARELNLSQVAPHADFRAIGGDSLSAVRIFLAVETELGHALPAVSLTKIHTVHEMAQVIETTHVASESVASPLIVGGLSLIEIRAIESVHILGNLTAAYPGCTLVKLNENGKLPPIFWGYNGNGNDRVLERLAAIWGPDQPIYGFFSGGRFFPNEETIFERLAHHYAAEIQMIQPEGPYIMGGHCKGAWIAMRIVKKLQAEGKKVSNLLLVEYGDAALAALPVPQLLIYGKHSLRFDYCGIGLTPDGPTLKFMIPPVIGWVSGGHGDMTRNRNLKETVSLFKRYLNGLPLPYTASDGLSWFILRCHRHPFLFKAYVVFSNVWSRLTRVFA